MSADAAGRTAPVETIDDLSADTTVYVSTDYHLGSVHRAEDCQALNRVQEYEQRRAGTLRDGYSLCRHPECWPRNGVPPAERQRRECPYCGDTVGRLRAHLPCEGVTSDE